MLDACYAVVTHTSILIRGVFSMANAQTIRTLNELIIVSRDGERGFRACAAHVRSERLRVLFVERSRSCGQAAEELARMVHELGGEPVTDSSTFGALHRRWLDIRAVFSSSDDGTIVAECERGEDYALEIYRNALDDHLPDPVRRIVLQQFEGVMNNYDQIRILGNETLARGYATAAPPASEVSS
jgi:uncharacterized protein (TIGR02284 family)